jgi:GWxTD domain-containing protein
MSALQQQNIICTRKIKFRKIISCSFVAITLFILGGCIAPPTQSTRLQKKDINNMSFLYDPSAVSLHPECAVWHNGDSLSTLYVGIPASEFLFNQANQKGDYLTKVKFKFELYRLDSEKNARQLADSASYTYNLQRDRLHGYFFTTMVFMSKPGERYNLRLITYDLMRRKSNQTFVAVDRSGKQNRQDFFAFTPSGQYPVLRNWVTDGKPFSLKVYPAGYTEIVVDYYPNNQPLPRPLYSVETAPDVNTLPDSTWVLPFSDTFKFSMPYKGLYHFRVDTSQPEGFTMLNPGTDFPEIKKPGLMVDPLVYITNSNEQRELEQSLNKKLAVDNFWLNCATNMQVSRELIKVYYNRITFSNIYFTCDREGWKTDRGMIYIVYGPPNSLYKTDDTEEWIYFPTAGRKINFIFEQQANRFSKNYFVLKRDLEATNYWRQAVDSWRNGRVFLVD